MGAKTGIEWTDATWNPIRGCSRVSHGCEHCYAESVAYRFSGPGQPYEGLAHKVNGHAAWTGKVEFAENHLLDPLKWKPVRLPQSEPEEIAGCYSTRPRRIFVNSMSDLFHEAVPDEWIDRIFAVMASCPQHTFQTLTKRPERMLKYLSGSTGEFWISTTDPNDKEPTTRADEVIGAALSLEEAVETECFAIKDRWPLPNVWLGVSVEDQTTADERIPLLLQTPASVRFISAEPLLGYVTLEELPSASGIGWWLDALSNAGDDSGALIPSNLDWVICGGESGPGARPMDADWCISLREQCRAGRVAFFMKQGSKSNWNDYKNIDSFPESLRVRQFPGKR